MASRILSSSARTWVVESRSLSVRVPSWRVWKSTVMPRGVPSSSFRLYRLPMLAEESSTRLETPRLRSF